MGNQMTLEEIRKRGLKRRILRGLVVREISGVDRGAQEAALVCIMKRDESHLSKFNHAHDQRGRFAAGDGGGGSTATNASAGDGGAVTPEHRDATLRWMQTAIRVVKIASWTL